ncbi:DUF2513 domain-containing protein [Pantoea hericii]|jgi:hypothetical protein|uniref:DUF2513 domain-containing protein n=1 Tax=Pantoea hericii TaxID=1815628 RepID=UPI0015F96176|nr:DUF2513 domain-containing protein [Pantoea hericii]
MKINQQYLKDLLIAFEDNEGPQTNILELQEAGFDFSEQLFIFHMRLLDDKNLIARIDGEPGFGFYTGADDSGSWAVLPLRLTAQGHDFIQALRQKEVWNSVKENFKDVGMSTLIDVSKELAKGFALKQAKRLTGYDPD